MNYTFSFIGYVPTTKIEVWAISDGGTVHLEWKDNKPLFGSAAVKSADNNWHTDHLEVVRQLENHIIQSFNEQQNGN